VRKWWTELCVIKFKFWNEERCFTGVSRDGHVRGQQPVWHNLEEHQHTAVLLLHPNGALCTQPEQREFPLAAREHLAVWKLHYFALHQYNVVTISLQWSPSTDNSPLDRNTCPTIYENVKYTAHYILHLIALRCNLTFPFHSHQVLPSNPLHSLIIGLCILLSVYQLNIGITSVRNKVFLVLDFIVHFSHYMFRLRSADILRWFSNTKNI
jgi:hypothetical protein